MKKDSLLTLKFPAALPNVGMFKELRGESVGTSSSGTHVLVKAVRMHRKWRDITPQKLHIEDNCVVSRQYVEPEPMQGSLSL